MRCDRLLAIALGMLTAGRASWFGKRCHGFTSLACVAVFSGPAGAGQIPLVPESVIGGSGAWNSEQWDNGPFAARLVADNQSAFRIDEPDRNPGTWP